MHCIRCQHVRTDAEFYKSRGKSKQPCKECINKYMFVYSRARYASVEGRAKQIFNNAKCRAKKRGIEFNLKFEFLRMFLEAGFCPKTGFKFDFNVPDNKYVGNLAPSLDRVNASKGYTNDNIQIVCNMFNMGKSDADELDFIAMCLAVADRNQNNQAAIARMNELRNAEL